MLLLFFIGHSSIENIFVRCAASARRLGPPALFSVAFIKLVLVLAQEGSPDEHSISPATVVPSSTLTYIYSSETKSCSVTVVLVVLAADFIYA